MRRLQLPVLVLFVLSFILTGAAIRAEDQPPAGTETAKRDIVKDVKKGEAERGRVVSIVGIKTPKRLKAAKEIKAFVKSFIMRDRRYTVTEKKDESTTHTISVKISKKGKTLHFSLKGAVLGGDEAEYTASLPLKPALAEIETQIMKGVRDMFDYQPEKTKVLLKILGSAAEGDADGMSIEDTIMRAIADEYEQVPADPYKLPVKDKDVRKLYKGDKKTLKTIRDVGGAELLIAGTVRMPKTKNVGGAASNNYRGKVDVKIRVWDLKRRMIISAIKLTFNGEGIFSELMFSLFSAAAEKSAAHIRDDLGFLEKEPED